MWLFQYILYNNLQCNLTREKQQRSIKKTTTTTLWFFGSLTLSKGLISYKNVKRIFESKNDKWRMSELPSHLLHHGKTLNVHKKTSPETPIIKTSKHKKASVYQQTVFLCLPSEPFPFDLSRPPSLSSYQLQKAVGYSAFAAPPFPSSLSPSASVSPWLLASPFPSLLFLLVFPSPL